AGELELSHLGLREPGRRQVRLRLEPDHLQDVQSRGGAGRAGRSRAGRVFHRNAEVLEDGHAGERLRDLKAPHDAEAGPLVSREARDVPAVEEDPPAIGRERARHAVDQGGLARPVRADEPEPFAGSHVKADSIEREEAAEALGYSCALETLGGRRYAYHPDYRR